MTARTVRIIRGCRDRDTVGINNTISRGENKKKEQKSKKRVSGTRNIDNVRKE